MPPFATVSHRGAASHAHMRERRRQAHIEAGMLVGLPFASSEPFDFKTSGMASKVQRHAAIFAEHRLTPPPKVRDWAVPWQPWPLSMCHHWRGV